MITWSKDGRVWGLVDGELVDVPDHGDKVYDLVLETVKMNKVFWDQQKVRNPNWDSSGSGNALRYLVCDKIAFAKCVGLLSEAQAKGLIEEVKSWT